MSLNAAVPETDLAVSQCVELPDLAEARRTSGWVWLARTFLVCAAGVLAWYTWGHWGDFQIDSGREIYVPVAILQGKLLFRDLCYIYGPFAPYVGALLFRIFGIHLSVLYFFGIGLTIAAALFTFEISRQFDLDIIPSLVPSIVFLLQAFQSFIFNFVFPYSYAASLASCLGLGCLYFAIRHSRDGRPAQLAIASVLGALVILTKQEFGVACLAILGVEIVARCLIERSGRNLKTNALVCGVGLLPAAGVYGWFVWKLSAKLIFFDNWISTPGTFFMRTFAKHTMPLQGFRFQPGEVLQSLTVLALTFLFWFGIAAANAAAIRRSTAAPRISTLVFILDLLIARTALMGLGVGANMIRVFLTDTLFPDGLFFASGLFALWAGWKLLRDRGFDSALAELILGVYAAVVSVRVMMELKPAFNSYAVFFNTPVFLIFTVLLVRIVRSRSEPLPFSKRGIFVSGMLATQVVLLAILIHPVRDPDAKPFTTDFGTF